MLRYYNVFFSIIVWLYALIFLKPARIKQLWPVGLIAALVLYITAFFFGTLGAYGFIDPFLSVLGIPFFVIVWAAGIGIVVIHYMPKEFYKKLIVIVIFMPKGTASVGKLLRNKFWPATRARREGGK